MVEVKITEDIKIGGSNPCFIIAEVGQNHQGDIETAKKLMKAAKVSTYLMHIFLTKLIVLFYRNQNKRNWHLFTLVLELSSFQILFCWYNPSSYFDLAVYNHEVRTVKTI